MKMFPIYTYIFPNNETTLILKYIRIENKEISSNTEEIVDKIPGHCIYMYI